MKGALIALFIGLAILVIFFSGVKKYRSKGTIDIHVYDTYLVLDYAFIIIFILLFLGTFFSIGGIIGSYFKSKLFWILSILFLSIDTYYILKYYKTFNDPGNTHFTDSSSS